MCDSYVKKRWNKLKMPRLCWSVAEKAFIYQSNIYRFPSTFVFYECWLKQLFHWDEIQVQRLMQSPIISKKIFKYLFSLFYTQGLINARAPCPEILTKLYRFCGKISIKWKLFSIKVLKIMKKKSLLKIIKAFKW